MAYRTTPHPATGLSPGEMLFRNGYRGAFPTRSVCTPSEFQKAVEKMKIDKNTRCADINQSPKRKAHEFTVGQWVYVRNRVRNKFDPLYFEDPWVIESVEKNGVILHNAQRNKRKIRHIDDIKPYITPSTTQSTDTPPPTHPSSPPSKAFYTLPQQTALQPSPSLPLDADVAVDHDEHIGEATLPPPQRSIAADRPERRCKRKEGYKGFY